jgi:hypothetical protein
MLAALLIVASMSLGPSPAVAGPTATVHASPAVASDVAASRTDAVQGVDFAAWLGEQGAAASAGFEPAAANCPTSCSQCPPAQRFCCPLLNGCVACTSHPTPCIQ